MTTLDAFTGKKQEITKSVETKPIIKVDYTPWTKKYSPEKEEDLVGQDVAIKKVKFFIENYKQQKKKAILLWGPSGVGKSSCVSALSDFEIVELNASDSRSKSVIEEKLGNALGQRSLFSKDKVILIDDVEGISGFYDRGGASAIVKLMANSQFPIVMTCHNPYHKKVSTLRKKSDLVEFKSISAEEIHNKLKFICEKESVEADAESLQIISENVKGDLRAAINDLQMLSIGKKKLDITMLDEMNNRLQSKDMQDALHQVFKSEEGVTVLNAFDQVDGAFNQNILWMDYNMPFEYTKKVDRAKAYGVISKADVFMRRIMRRQHWRFLVYVNALLTAGVATSKVKVYDTEVQYKQSSRILKIWQMNMKYAKRQAIAQKIAEKTHSSKKEIIKNFDYYKIMSTISSVASELSLDKEEIAFLAKI